MTTPTADDSESTRAQATAGMVVGIDGSPGSAHALKWAAGRTEQFGLIRPVASWNFPVWALGGPDLAVPPSNFYENFASSARSEAEEAIAAIPENLREPLVVIEAPAGPALVEQGEDAGLIVVGTRGRGAVADKVLGSVSCHVVAHATTPVAVVPASAEVEKRSDQVVVGIDGSANSVAALAWAMSNTDESTRIEALHAWSHHAAAIPDPYTIPVEYSEVQAERTLDRVVREATGAAGDDARAVVKRLHYGDPRLVLRDASAQADLLVVGARGHRGVAHLLLGSVTTGLVHQPRVTTIVVPQADS